MAMISGDNAGKDGKEKGLFPQVHFRDDDPKKGFTTIQLSIPGLKVKKILFKEPQTNADISVNLDTGLVDVRVTLHDGSGVYAYSKSLPADIYPLRSKYTLKPECVKLSLAKAKPEEPWTSHAKYFMHKSTNQDDQVSP